MRNLLYVVAFALLMAWALGYYIYGSRGFIHVLLFLVVAVVVYDILRTKKRR